MVGTIKKNKRELSPEFNTKRRSPMTTISGVQPNMISTLHNDDNVDERTSMPEINLLYNKTKGGVDVVCGTTSYHFCYIFPPHQRRVNTISCGPQNVDEEEISTITKIAYLRGPTGKKRRREER
jgi:hypothetical protein